MPQPGRGAEKVDGIAELEAALPAAQAGRAHHVIVIDTDPHATTEEGGAWWDVPVTAASPRRPRSARTRAALLRDAPQRARAKQERRRVGRCVKLGINPIAWTNDDMPELGGDTPLETCLTEGGRGRLRRHRDGQQVPARRQRSSGRPAAARAGAGLRLVRRRAAERDGRGGDRGDAAAYRRCWRPGLHGHGLRPRPRAPCRAGATCRSPTGRCMARGRVAGAASSGSASSPTGWRARASPGLSPPHGHGDREAPPRSTG